MFCRKLSASLFVPVRRLSWNSFPKCRHFSAVATASHSVQRETNAVDGIEPFHPRAFQHSAESYAKAIRDCEDNVERASRIFMSAVEWRRLLFPTVAMANALMTVAKSAKRLDIVHGIYTRMADTSALGQRDSDTHVTSNGQIPQRFRDLDLKSSIWSRFIKNEVTHSIFFNAMLRNREYATVQKYFDELRQEMEECLKGKYAHSDTGIHLQKCVLKASPTTITSAGITQDLSRAKQVFDSAIAICDGLVDGSSVQLRSFAEDCKQACVSAYAIVLLENDSLQGAIELLRFHSDALPQTTIQSLLRNAVAKRQHSAATDETETSSTLSVLQLACDLDKLTPSMVTSYFDECVKNQKWTVPLETVELGDCRSDLFTVFTDAFVKEHATGGSPEPGESCSSLKAFEGTDDLGLSFAGNLWKIRSVLSTAQLNCSELLSRTLVCALQCVVNSRRFETVAPLLTGILWLNLKETVTGCCMWAAIETGRHCEHSRIAEQFLAKRQTVGSELVKVRAPLNPLSIMEVSCGKVPLSVAVLNEALYYLIKVECQMQTANELLKAFTKRIDIRTYNILITGIGLTSNLQLVDSLLEEMAAKGVKANGATHMNLMRCASINGDLGRGVRYFRLLAADCLNAVASRRAQDVDQMIEHSLGFDGPMANGSAAVYFNLTALHHLLNTYAVFIAKQFDNVLRKDLTNSGQLLASRKFFNDCFAAMRNVVNEKLDSDRHTVSQLMADSNVLGNAQTMNIFLTFLRNALRAINNVQTDCQFADARKQQTINALSAYIYAIVNDLGIARSKPIAWIQDDAGDWRSIGQPPKGRKRKSNEVLLKLLCDCCYFHESQRLTNATGVQLANAFVANGHSAICKQQSLETAVANGKKWKVDLHRMTRSLAYFYVLSQLKLLARRFQESGSSVVPKHGMEIVTGKALHSEEWTPVLMPTMRRLLAEELGIDELQVLQQETGLFIDSFSLQKWCRNTPIIS